MMKKLIILIAIGLLIFLIMQFPHLMINPGELAQSHQKLKNECLSCHKPFGGIANEKCISCHDLASIGKDETGKQSKTLFHQHLSKQECNSCHTEHQGLIPEHSLSGFKHELLSETIINNCSSCHNKPADKLHTNVAESCSSCHQSDSWKGAGTFNHDFLLDKSNCASCHQKPKDSFHSIVNDNCDKCHGNSKWVPSMFDHSSYFNLDQNHSTTCNTCHSNNNYSSYTCFGCHEHSESNIVAEHSEEGIYNISKCASCHRSGNEHESENNSNNLNEQEKGKVKEYIKSQGNKEDDDD